MQQITLYISGERDYAKIHGDTGPLVYPAMHVYIYRLLHYFTDAGRDVRSAQYIFTALYLTTLLLVMQCYRSAKVPPYIFPLLVASKRLHSIFLLRLFNDCWAVFFLWLAIWCYQRRLRFWSAGSLAFSVGVGVKMTVLLALPAVGLVLWQGMGRDRAMNQGLLMGQLQVRWLDGATSVEVADVGIDFDCLPVPYVQPAELYLEGFRLFTPISVQVDRELAVRGRGDFSVQALRGGAACSSR